MTIARIHVLSCSAEQTTARYFERAARQRTGITVSYWTKAPRVERFTSDDLLLIVDPWPDLPLGIESCPCTVAAYLIDVHQDLRSRAEVARWCDAVFVAQKSYVASLASSGLSHVHWLPLACEPSTHCRPAGTRGYEVGFVGKLGPRGTYRRDMLERVLPHFHTNDYGRFYRPSDMADVYARSKIVFNVSINRDLNMRFFEAMASGAMLVTDRIPENMDDRFQEGVHYIGYTTADEAISKVREYLANDVKREAIARTGQAEALAQHKYADRLNDVLNQIDGTCGDAPARKYTNRELSALYSSCFATLRQPQRIGAVARRYGASGTLLRNLALGSARWVNARVPLTPNAIRARISRR